MAAQHPFVCRFAPSPNGLLHLGHALSARINHEAARHAGGTYLLRLEDIDATRCRREFEAAILDDLAWLGLAADAPPRRQSEHMDAYATALARLERDGLVYPAFESRSEIAQAVLALEQRTGRPAPRDPDGAPLYPFARRDLTDRERAQRVAAGAPYALRLDMAAALEAVTETPLDWQEAQGTPDGPLVTQRASPAMWGDVILARRDTPTSYHLCVVVDDAVQGITHVIRGEDLFPSTSVHRLLQALLGLAPPLYHHHRLILDRDGHKLSKSSGATSIAAYRAAGASPAQVLRMMEGAQAQPTPIT